MLRHWTQFVPNKLCQPTSEDIKLYINIIIIIYYFSYSFIVVVFWYHIVMKSSL